MLSHHHNQGSTCSDELSWSSPRRRPSCWGRVQWMWQRSNGGYRYCWTGGDSHAFGSLVGRTWKTVLLLKCLSNSACKMFGWSFIDGPQWQPTTSSSSTSTMSYALRAAMKMIQVTPSKQWIHFFLSERWPPTSNILQNTKISLLALVSIQAYLIQFFDWNFEMMVIGLFTSCHSYHWEGWRCTWSGGPWKRTGSRWYRWSSLLIAGRPVQ